MEKTEKNVGFKVVDVIEDGITFKHSEEVVKRIRDLTDEDIEKLSSVAYCSISSSKNNRTKQRRYILSVHLLNGQIFDDLNLKPSEYDVICSSHGMNVDLNQDLKPTKISCKVRFLHGVSSTGERYRSCQYFPLGKQVVGLKRNRITFSQFVDDVRISQFITKKMIDKITFKTASADEETPLTFEEISY